VFVFVCESTTGLGEAVVATSSRSNSNHTGQRVQLDDEDVSGTFDKLPEAQAPADWVSTYPLNSTVMVPILKSSSVQDKRNKHRPRTQRRCHNEKQAAVWKVRGPLQRCKMGSPSPII
jgi:hypothetical protein